MQYFRTWIPALAGMTWFIVCATGFAEIYNVKLDAKISAKSIGNIYSKGVYLDSDFTVTQTDGNYKFSLLKQNQPAFGIIKYEKDSLHFRQLREKEKFRSEEEFVKSGELDAEYIIKNWKLFYQDYYPELDFDKLKIYPIALRIFFGGNIQNLFEFTLNENYAYTGKLKNNLKIDYRGIKEEWKINGYQVLGKSLQLMRYSLKDTLKDTPRKSSEGIVNVIANIFKIIEPKHFKEQLKNITIKYKTKIVQNDNNILSLKCDLDKNEIAEFNNGDGRLLKESSFGKGENIFFDRYLRQSTFKKQNNSLIFDRIKVLIRGEEGTILFFEISIRKNS